MTKPKTALALLLTLGALSGCTNSGSATNQTSTTNQTTATAQPVSPLVGTWTRDGDTPKPDAKAPQFTSLTFGSDGSLEATYVAAGGALAGVIAKPPKVQSEHDSYTTPDSATLRIAEGSAAREYAFRMSGGKLYLTPAGGSDAAVFTKSAGAS